MAKKAQWCTSLASFHTIENEATWVQPEVPGDSVIDGRFFKRVGMAS